MRKVLLFCFTLLLGVSSFSLVVKEGKIIDKFGNSIENKVYKRVIVLDPGVVETFFLLNAENSIIGIAKPTMSKIYPEDGVKKIQNIGSITRPSIEKIIISAPDLVIASRMSIGVVDNLKNLKIPVIVNTSENFSEILSNIQIYSKITGNIKQGEKLYNESVEKLNKFKKLTKNNPINLKGAVLYSTSPLMGFNSKSLPGEILEILGIENIASDLLGDKPILSPEFIINKNPDFLAGAMSIKNVKDIENSNSAVKLTKAGKNKNYFIVNSDKILRGSPRIFDVIGEFYEELQKVEAKNNIKN